MNEPFVPTTSNLYDVVIECDSSTKVIFRKLEQMDVLRLMHLTREAVVIKDYGSPQAKGVSLIVSVNEEDDGSRNKELPVVF